MIPALLTRMSMGAPAAVLCGVGGYVPPSVVTEMLQLAQRVAKRRDSPCRSPILHHFGDGEGEHRLAAIDTVARPACGQVRRKTDRQAFQEHVMASLSGGQLRGAQVLVSG